MSTGLDVPGREAGTLVESLVRAGDPLEACDILLEHAVDRCGFRRAAALVDDGSGLRGVVQLSPGEAVARIAVAYEEIRPAMLSAVGSSRSTQISGGGVFPALGFESYRVFPLTGLEGDSVGAVIVEGSAVEPDAEDVAAQLACAGPVLDRLLELDRLRSWESASARDRELLLAMVDILPDPVVLTDRDNQILLSNRRADQLLNVDPEDTEGRRRAVEVNNLFLSSHLTQATVGGGEERRAGELNLVNPEDGTDLVFEVFSRSAGRDEVGARAVITVLRDITDLKQALGELEDQISRSHLAEQQIRRESERLQVIIENVGEPILVTDQRSNIILMNREAEYLFDVPEDTPPGVPEGRVIRANDTKFTSLMSEFLLRPERRTASTLQVGDPESVDTMAVEVVSTKIFDRRGDVIAVVSVLHDLSPYIENERLASELSTLNQELEQRVESATEELERRNRELEEQRHRLEKASKAKSSFLAGVSHELRTPINAILGYTSLLMEGIYGELSDKQLQSLQKVQSASDQLLTLISDILDLSKIEAGKVTVEAEEFPFEAMADDLMKTIEPLARERGLGVAVDFAEEIPLLHTDRQKLYQILLNLLSNAVKFTDEGGLTFRCRCDGDEEWLWVDVEDTGVGVDEDELEAIFEEFHQSERTNRQARGGTGLGLAITRRLSRLLGATVSVESTPGEGSVFTVRVPVRLESVNPGAEVLF